MINQANAGSEEKLFITRLIDASPERVFAAWTNPKLLQQWWGPPGSTIEEIEIDLQIGGRYRLGLRQGEQPLYYVSGTYKIIQPPQKLAFTWRWENPEMDIGISLVTLEFQALGDKTQLQLTHAQLPTAEARLAHGEGWMSILAKLDDFLVT